MKDALVKLGEADKALEKNFKKEFPGFNYNQLEALMKSYRCGFGSARCLQKLQLRIAGGDRARPAEWPGRSTSSPKATHCARDSC